MPPRFLQIRTRGRASPRVVNLSAETIRIGRGVLCEARVDDPALAEVECLLRLTGETWHIQPLGRGGRVTIDGRAVEHLRAVAPNVAIRIGDATITLRDRAEADAPFGAIEVPAATCASAWAFGARDDSEDRLGDRPYVAPRPKPRPTVPTQADSSRATVRCEPDRRSRPAPEPEVRPQPVARSTRTEPEPGSATRRPTPAERMWQARWRAVGRALRATGEVTQVDDGPATVPFAAKKADPALPKLAVHEDFESSAVAWAIPDADPVAVSFAAAPEQGGDDLLARSTVADLATVPVEPAPAATPETTPTPEPSPAVPPLLHAAPRKPKTASPPHRAPASEPRRAPAPAPAPAPSAGLLDDPAWPTVQSLLSASRPIPTRPRPAAKPVRSRPSLTIPSRPKHWSFPVWLALPACILVIGTVGAVGVLLALAWGTDDREAGVLADRLFAPNATTVAEGEINPDATWWKTTSGHLSTKAAALGAGKGPASREESARFLLDAARSVAPLEPASRLARAEIASRSRDASSLPALGMSRDASALALTARLLAREGKTEPALNAYRSALALAAQGVDPRNHAPMFLDSPDARRFALTAEATVLDLVREMATQPGWTFATWSPALPEHGLVLLATYRVLNDRGAAETEAALAKLVACGDAPETGSPALHLAAKAEGLALSRRGVEGASLYNEAITRVGDEATRRAWHLNRALILARSGEREKAIAATVAARAGRGDDEIGHRVAQSLIREGLSKPFGNQEATTTPATSGMLRTRAN